jgi:hypothetical protein
MSVVKSVTGETEEVFQGRRKHMLFDIECGALVTAIMVAVAVYIHGPIIMIIAAVFLLVEICNIFDYCVLCRSHKKDPTT